MVTTKQLIINNKIYEAVYDKDGVIIEPPREVLFKPPEIKIDELKASKFFIKHRDVLTKWLKTSTNPDILRSILSRQSSQVDRELLDLLIDFVQSEIDNADVDLSEQEGALFTQLLNGLKAEIA